MMVRQPAKRTGPARPQRRARCLALVAALMAALPLVVTVGVPSAVAAPATAPISLTPVADAFVSAQAPSVNFGAQDYLDVFGGTNPSCTSTPDRLGGFTGQAYGLLKFDLSSIPAGAVVTGASLKMTTRAGYAQDGDQNHHLIRLADTSWTEGGVTWANRPIDGAPTPGDPASGGQDIRAGAAALGSTSVFRATCGGDFTGDEAKALPTNGIFGATDQAMSRDDAEANFVAAISGARSTLGALLSLELYNPDYFAGGSTAYWARYYTKEAVNPALRPKLVLTFASAGVVQAVPNGANTIVSAKLNGQASTAYTVNVVTAATCIGGRFKTATPTLLGTLAATTDATGAAYVTGTLPGALAFINVSLSSASGELTASSPCVAVGPDNDVWPRALSIPLAGGGPLTGSATGYVDAPGGARWYKFAVQPGSKVHVDLKNLPADYDLALFKDISQTFNTLNSTSDLTRLSAEFSPSAFSPSAFSPSAFSPSAFSPSAFSPSAFSPSAFSPSVFSPSAFSPSAFSPSAFSPSAFSPSAFSPSAFSPSAFSPSSFSPSAFSPAGVSPLLFSPETFASAQTRSLIATSSTPGTGDESVVADTWNNTGSFYVRVSGRNGAFSTASPFTLLVTRDDNSACAGVNPIGAPPSAPAGSFQTIILLDSSRMPAGQPGNSPTDISALQTKLAAFAARSEVQGAVVNLAGDARIQALNAQADGHRGCPYAKNLVAAATKDIVTAYRTANPALKYVVLIGPDGAVPFFRYPDEGLLGPESDYTPPVGTDTSSEASLRLNYVLGQDEYGSSTTLALGGATLPAPDLAVGRLVETASEASGMLDAYTALPGGVVAQPTRALVTGYDFLADDANAVAGDLARGIGGANPVDSLIAPNNISPQDPQAWTATQLRDKLFGSRHDLVFLAGHFSANSALAADFATSVLSTELAGSATDFTNTVIFSAGCHSGYNIVDADAIPGVTAPLDWAQAAARKKATLIAGTGYQYGDTDFVEYSERIYSGLALQLRYGTGPVSFGQALMRSKQAYLKSTPDARGLHRKALIEAALFGLPMLSVNLPGRLPTPTDPSIIGATTPFTVNPGSTLGLSSADMSMTAALTPHTVALTGIDTPSVTATYYSGPDGVATNPAEPAVPLVSKNVTVTGKVLRGVGFRGGTYTDSTVTPLTGAATTELRGVHTPFSSPVFFPMRLATVNYFDALSNPGGDTRLLVTPAQHHAIAGSTQSTLRLFSNVDMRLYYSANISAPALSAAPSISGASAVVEGGDIVFRASVTGNPAAGIQQVWVTYTGDGPARWAPLDLAQCVITAPQTAPPSGCGPEDSTRWVGRLVGGAGLAPALRFMVQAANGVGLVTMDDALGAYYGVSQPAATAPVPVATALVLQSPPASAVYGSTITASAVLTSAGTPVANKLVTFAVGSSSGSATTSPSGVATALLPLNVVPGPLNVQAFFAGDPGLLPSSASSPLSVQKSPTALSLELTPPPGTSGPLGVRATLTAANGGPIPQRTIYLVIAGAEPTWVVPLTTDYLGRAVVSQLLIGAGPHTLTAMFLGTVPFPPPAAPAFLTDPTYLPSSSVLSAAPTVIWSGFFQPVDNPPTLNSAKGGSALPAKFSLHGNYGSSIFAAGYPQSIQISCDSGVPESEIDQMSTAGASVLSYDAASDQYSYVWKTDKAWAGTCRQLLVVLIDRTSHVANFKFK